MDAPPLRFPNPVRAVIFDMDGTLVDTEPHHHRSTAKMLARVGHTMTWEEYLPYIGASELGFWTDLKERFGLKESVPELARTRIETIIGLLESEPVPLLPGIRPLLEHLQRHGLPAAVASSSPTRQIEATLRGAGIREFFSVIRSGHDDVPHSKPAPDVYLATAKALKLAPETCLALEDSVPGITAARASGAFAIAVGPPSPVRDRVAHLHLSSAEDLIPRIAKKTNSRERR